MNLFVFRRPLPSIRVLAVFLAFTCGGSSAFAPPFSLEGPGVDADDFQVTVFANGLDFPLGMAELPDGSILATVNEGSSFYSSAGKLVRFVDADADGVADGEPQVVYDDLSGGVTSVQLGGSLAFVVASGRPLTILRLGDSLDDPLTFVGRIEFDYPGGSTYHGHSTLEVRETPGVADSYDLFFQVGSEANFAESTREVPIQSSSVADVSGVLKGASAYMMTLADEGSQVRMTDLVQIGTGLRNAAGFTLHPTRGDLYLQDNGIDGLDDVNEPHSADELNLIAREEIAQGPIPDFGFPDNYTAYRTDEFVGGEGVAPVVAFQPIPDPFTGLRSEGPNDIAFAPPGFPEGLNDGIFLGFHGKFNKAGLQNDENPVVYADPETGEYFHFILGQQEGIGHLDGLLATRDSLFVADLNTNGNMGDGAGAGVIYKIEAVVPPTPPKLTGRRTGSEFELRWDRGNLQKAEELSGPWEDLDDVFSPYPIDLSGSQRFYRATY